MRARTGWGIGLAVLGALCLVAAALLVWVVVPNRKQLPADTNTTRQFEGTAKVLSNPQALSSGDLRNALATNVPVTAQRVVKVEATDGDAALVSDQRQLMAGGRTVGQTQAKYAVNRKSLEATTSIPSDWDMTPHEGLTVSWPIGVERKDYTGWVNETQSTVPLKYQREEEKGGVDTYVYTSATTAKPIKDTQVLSSLPPALPVTTLAALASVVPISPEVQAGLAQALPRLADPVPLSYTYEATSTFWVEPTTGLVVDTDREEIREAGIGEPGGTVLASVPVYDVSTSFTEQSVTDAANEAKDKKSQITTFGKTLPSILGIVGALLVIGGLVLALTGRRGRRGVGPAPETATGYPSPPPSTRQPPPTQQPPPNPPDIP
jgi:hypothetical protein